MADTTFARVDMGSVAEEVLRRRLPGYRIVRHTVPGIKDLPGAAKRILSMGCEGVITLGWVGRREADKLSYLAASVGLIMVEVLTGKIVIDVTVHEDEAEAPEELAAIAVDRARKHAENLAALIREGPEALVKHAGMGLRQGYPDAGPIK
ncbi:riboflavin synthase [Aeropyrum pernix]|uniref:Riboflavin synthase n=1 Tax=Aeropyrum pernix TaxID=56636 RepID=A0A401H8Y5_AERPX|nr:riboflavin synthase [Aeropyrum pernix]GBF08874.1 riboflavin synthase [Aeropyrum pernix]